MKKTISIVSLIIITLLTQSCSYDDTFNLEIKENKLVLNAVLVANEIPTIYVGKVFNPTGNVPDSNYIADAEVKLFENNSSVGSLIFQKNGVYTLQIGRAHV